MKLTLAKCLGPVSVLVVTAVAVIGLSQSRGPEVLAKYHTSLDGRNTSQRHNATLAVQKLTGAVIPPHSIFSFNGRVGSFSRDVGYRRAPVSYNGQLIDAWGGGVCQASTTLYNAALLAGMKILERNRHHFAPSYVPVGLDAAVAYSNIDLRFENPYDFPVEIRATIDARQLSVQFVGPQALKLHAVIVQNLENRVNPALYQVGGGGRFSRMRNSGKSGYDVTVYRLIGNRRELISTDHYPAMARVVESS